MTQQLSLFDIPPAPPRPPGRVLIAHGARAAERMLLERLDGLLNESRKDPSLLARPARIIVPSRSLRLHLSAAIVRRRGRSAAGVILQTLFGLASEVLERAGEPVPRGAGLFEALAQRAAREEAILRRGLDDLVDGYGAVTGTVRDLLDAGLEPVHAEAAEEILAADGPQVATQAEVERALALVRTAARAEEQMRDLDLGRVAALLRRALELLETDPERGLPSRAVLIHGFSDATGVATDLIQTLLRKCSAWLVLDHPPRPEDGGAERAFPARFEERLALAARMEPPTGDPPVPPRLEAFEAVGGEAEAREVARRLRELLDGGVRPEAVGVVARDFGPYRHALRRHLGRLGIPFSGVGEAGGLAPGGRRAQAFLELLRQGDAVPADRWLDAQVALPGGSGASRVDLRLAFYSLGAARLRDLPGLRLDTILREGSYPLPIRQGLKTPPAGEEEEEGEGRDDRDHREAEAYAQRRRVKGPLLRAAVRTAGRVLDRLGSWPEEDSVSSHLARLHSLLTKDLGWDLAAEEARPVAAALAELAREAPPDLALSRDELRLLLERGLAKAGAVPVGGAGGGVQVLSVVEARARTFDHLFLMGLNRDVFPRTVREDPLLPDDLRRVLQRVLPDVPVKRSGFDEERYLFAQLLSASPSVFLSWQAADEDGKPLAPSPLVERLRERVQPRKAPSLWALPAAGPLPGLRTAAEHAVMAGLHAPRRWFGRVLPLAIGESRGNQTDPSDPSDWLPATSLAASRLAVLEELDPDLRTPEGRAVRARPGPYFGFIGRLEAGTEGEPRLRPLFVTQLENLAACPWQLFLGRLLRIEPTPDPVGALPGLDALILGNAVHSVLERIVRAAAGEEWAGPVRDRTALPVPWLSEEEVGRLALEESARLLAEEGIFLPGLARALAERALPLLESARELDWSGGAVPVLGTEVQGDLAVTDAAGRERPLHFKADRVDRAGRLLVWTDYKTGKPISDKKTADTRRKHFLERVRRGTHLQAVAYLLATGGDALGRYLFLRPGFGDPAERAFEASAGDRDFTHAFAAAVQALLAAWDQGAFFPRLVDETGRKEPSRCGFCSVAEACVRGDSGARQRLWEWTERVETGETGAEEALLGVWRLWEKEEG